MPEVASRRHSEVISAITAEALQRADARWEDLEGIAVTNGPGLVGSLLVGVAAAKGYALATGLPLVGVNHVEAHLFANFVHGPNESPAARDDLLPAVCLVASGGHSDIVLMRQPGDYKILGWTRDDAAGEALDKAARVMQLGYPGGPAIDRAAKSGDPSAVQFPRPVIADGLDFSFSGLKTAMVREHQARSSDGGPLDESTVADLAASFQEAVVDTLVRNLTQAAVEYGARQVLLAGGVAANSRLRQKMASWHADSGVPVAFPPVKYCTDNAVMVAAAGFAKAARHGWDDLDIDVYSALPLADHV